MRIYDIIMKKRGGAPLTEEEIRFFVKGYVSGEIPDYQASALLMAIWFRGMDSRETAHLTMQMAQSGDMVDLSAIPGVKVDKHSTGGVGDKTSLIVGPIVAACGVKVAKMSGRGLGHTGGTVDKLESIPGLRTAIGHEEFFQIVRDTGIAIIGQSGNIAPADKKLYALRDATATVDSLPLIASSIMSKKLAAGSDAILLDVKTGGGAFMKTLADAVKLARAMVEIGTQNGRNTVAVVTDMDVPLGNAIGNSLEVAEAVRTLQGEGPADLTEVCLELARNMLELAGVKGDCKRLARDAVDSGAALNRLAAMVEAQGGDPDYIRNPLLFARAGTVGEYTAPEDGYIAHMDTETCGIASVALGAGRARMEDRIDYSAGLILLKKPGDRIAAGAPVARLYASDAAMLDEGRNYFARAVTIGAEPPKPQKVVLARVDGHGTVLF